LFPPLPSVPTIESPTSGRRLPRVLRLAALSAAVAASCLAAGCGGGGAGAATTTQTTASDGAAGETTSGAGSTSAGSTTSTSTGGGTAPGGTGSSGTSAAGDGSATTADADATDPDTLATIQNTGARDTVAAITADPATTSATGAKVYAVGGSSAPAGAIHVATMAAVPWATLPAGSAVVVAAGTYPGVTTIAAVGTQAAPITITAADPAHPPVFTNSFDFQHASHVQLSHVTVQSPAYAGVIVRQGSDHVVVSDSTIRNAPVGLTITDGAGTGHQFLRNLVVASVAHGISVEVNADPAERTLIAHNTVTGSGQHGMEIRASHYQIEYNTVAGSGAGGGGGVSGIHVYSGGPTEDSGDDNLVRYNLAYGSLDPVAFDGNGIEIDQWCDGNTVAYNQVWGNDGAGIIVYDGSGNLVQNNTAWGDGLDSGHSHVARGEIVVSGTAAATVHGNRVWNNVASSTIAAVPALYVDSRAVAGGNAIGANLYWNAASGGLVVRWTDGLYKQTAALIDATTGVPGSVVAAPAFANTTTKLSNGLRLTKAPALPGLMPAGQSDFAAVAATAGQAWLGAYFTAAN
jgi:parallel beta-helix repeat protein